MKEKHDTHLDVQQPDAATRLNLTVSVEACLQNGKRLLAESYDLEFRQPPSSQFFLIMIAQEEFAKAFLLYLIRESVAPFSAAVRRAINDHVCKQLLAVVLDYMIMHWEDVAELEAAIEEDFDLGDDQFPLAVASALEILCNDKIGRWGADRHWFYVERPIYDTGVLKIAEGRKDRRKQDALYVRIGGDGRACVHEPITETETKMELNRADRYARFVADAAAGTFQSIRFLKVLQAFRALLAKREERGALSMLKPG